MFYLVRSYGSSPAKLHADLRGRAVWMRDRLAARLPAWGQPRDAFVTALLVPGLHGEGRAVFGVDLEVRAMPLSLLLFPVLAAALPRGSLAGELCGFG